MELGKLRSGRVELVVCLLGPVLAFAAIVIPGRVYCSKLQRTIEGRRDCLAQMPRLETQLAEARRVLQPFVSSSANGDKAAELTLAVEKAAQSFGFVTRSVDVAKQGEGPAWVDYRVVISGGGTLKSAVGMLSFLENPARRFRVGKATLRGAGDGHADNYDGEIVLVSRAITPVATSIKGAAVARTDVSRALNQPGRLSQLVASVKSWVEEKTANPKFPTRQDTVQAQPSAPTVPFTLNGIVRDRKIPLALTDRGVIGIGDKIDGFTLRSVADDHVVVMEPGGTLLTVQLYAESLSSP